MLTVATFFLGACGPSEEQLAQPEAPKKWQWQQCVDENGNIVPDEHCEEAQRHSGGVHGGYMPYHWWYINGGRPLFMGQNIHQLPENRLSQTPVSGAQASRVSGFTSAHPAHPSYGKSTITRGVFGSSASGRSALG